GAASLLRWQNQDQFTVIFDHPDAPGRNTGIGPFDLKDARDRVIAADVDGDGREELLLYRPGRGAAPLLWWQNQDQFTVIFDHPDAPGRNTGIGPFNLKDDYDQVIAADVDGDGREELLLYRPGRGAATLLLWQAGETFTTIFDHPDI